MLFRSVRSALAFTCTLLLLGGSQLSAAVPPNVVLLLADDSGWGDYSFTGNTNLRTPNIDSIARGGANFDRFYVCAVCAPTRAEFLTGRYHPRGGVRGVSTGQERLNLDEHTLAEAFKAAGYVTGAFGKWHNGEDPATPEFQKAYQENWKDRPKKEMKGGLGVNEDRKSTRLNSSHSQQSRMPSSA